MRAVNLIPSEQRSGTSVGVGRSQGAAYAVLALCAGIAVLALLYGKASHEASNHRAEVAKMTAEAQQAQTDASRLAPYTTFIALREQRKQAVAELVDSRFDWAHVFHEFGRVLPAGVSISALNGTVGSASPTLASAPAASSAAGAAAAASSASSATPSGSVPTFTLTGCATSQQEVALMLERLRLMDGVSEVTLQSSTKAGGGGGAGCPKASYPAFAATVTFDPLPSTAAASAATTAKTVALGGASATRSASTGAKTR